MGTVPRHPNVSIDTIRRFFNAYLSHKYVIDYLAELGADKLVAKYWVSSTKARNVHEQLVKLQDVLNYNVINIAHLVRQILYRVEATWWNYICMYIFTAEYYL